MPSDRQRRRLRAIIRLKLETGLLPKTAINRVWAGPGNNEVCSVCDETISRHDTIYEWETDGDKVQMHLVCYEVWREERQRRPRRMK